MPCSIPPNSSRTTPFRAENSHSRLGIAAASLIIPINRGPSAATGPPSTQRIVVGTMSPVKPIWPCQQRPRHRLRLNQVSISSGTSHTAQTYVLFLVRAASSQALTTPPRRFGPRQMIRDAAETPSYGKLLSAALHNITSTSWPPTRRLSSIVMFDHLPR